jgi:hypothetical protein
LPLTLPNLDDLRWSDLIEEGRARLIASSKTWTDHNPSDPGITLMELFAFVSGTLMYQLNRITEADTEHFLNLLSPPRAGRKKVAGPNADLPLASRATAWAATNADHKRRTFRERSLPLRAVTAEDYETLTVAVPGVARAICLPGRNLENEDPVFRWQDAPGHVSVVVLPLPGVEQQPELLAEVRQVLEPARMLTTRVHAVLPRRVPVAAQFRVMAGRNAAPTEELREAIAARVRDFLDPYRGWFDETGWPLGRNLYVSELYELISGISGVESIGPSRSPDGVLRDELRVESKFATRLARDSQDRLQAVTLRPDELFAANVDAAAIEIARHAG